MFFYGMVANSKLLLHTFLTNITLKAVVSNHFNVADAASSSANSSLLVVLGQCDVTFSTKFLIPTLVKLHMELLKSWAVVSTSRTVNNIWQISMASNQ